MQPDGLMQLNVLPLHEPARQARADRNQCDVASPPPLSLVWRGARMFARCMEVLAVARGGIRLRILCTCHRRRSRSDLVTYPT